jgi:hypothetical protein
MMAEMLGFEASECGFERMETFICLQNESMSDLLAKVVPPWSR